MRLHHLLGREAKLIRRVLELGHLKLDWLVENQVLLPWDEVLLMRLQGLVHHAVLILKHHPIGLYHLAGQILLLILIHQTRVIEFYGARGSRNCQGLQQRVVRVNLGTGLDDGPVVGLLLENEALVVLIPLFRRSQLMAVSESYASLRS